MIPYIKYWKNMDMNIKLESEEAQVRKKKSLYIWEGSTLKFMFLIVKKKIHDTFSTQELRRLGS